MMINVIFFWWTVTVKPLLDKNHHDGVVLWQMCSSQALELNSLDMLSVPGDSISNVMWHSRRLCMSRPWCPGEQQRSPPPVYWLSFVPPVAPRGGLLGNHSSPHAAYKRAFPLTPHSDMPLLPHQTTTLEGMTLKNKQPTKHINGFCKGYEVEVLWMTYSNSNHRCCQTKAQTSLDWQFCCFMFAFIDHYV